MAQNAAARLITEEESSISERPTPTGVSLKSSPTYQAYQILHAGFTIAPIVAGLDKFSNRLVQWDQYLAPVVPRTLGISAPTFMKIVGGVEIVAGIGVAVKPKVFGYVVSGWLGGIIGNLLVKRAYYDIALRDLGLSLGALALGRLSQDFGSRHQASAGG